MDLFFKLTGPVLAIIVLFFGLFTDKDSTGQNQNPTEQRKKTWERRGKWLTIAGLLIACIAVLYDRAQNKEKERKSQEEIQVQQAKLDAYQRRNEENQQQAIEQTKKLEESQNKLGQSQDKLVQSQDENFKLSSKVVDLQNRGIQQLHLLSLDRTFSGLEISYKPTAQEWNAIVQVYRTITPPNGEPSYYDSPMIATRAGAFWRIDFAEVSMKEGRKWFPPVFTDDVKNRGFEQILQKASLPLWISWGTGAQTFLEPMRGDYPSEIRLSPEIFIFTLRPPLLDLNLDSLHGNSLITLRSRRRWSELTFHSLDPAVKLDQTLQLEWGKGTPDTPHEMNSIAIKERLHPYVSGPHRLKMSFKTLTQ